MAGMNMQEMMKQARKMQEQLAQAQESMKDVTIDASAGGGMVKATVNGDLELVSIQIDPDALDPVLGGAGREGEFGWDGWAGTYFMADPASDMIVLYFISRIDFDPSPMRAQLKRILYGE